MQKKSFLFFHFNLFFSSIDKNERKQIIKNCYYPIINLARIYNTPINIEASARTLLEIKKIDKNLIKIIIKLINNKMIYFVGSGLNQIIAPLVPYEINCKNLEIGNFYYKEILGKKPDTALINEMAFSENILEAYSKFGYKNIIIDYDNLNTSLKKNKKNIPNYCYSNQTKKKLKITYASSFLFQQFQNCIYGDISIKKYLHILKKYNNEDIILPIYSGDAEVFNFRAGRFISERKKIHDEWERIYKLLNQIKKMNINFCLIDKLKKISTKNLLYQEKSESPISVKKQPKYNISRWAITGRSDQKINTACYKIFKNRKEIIGKIGSRKFYEEILDLWSSDYRTHITKKRWTEYNHKLNKVLKIIKKKKIIKNKSPFKAIRESDSVYYDSEKTLLYINTKKIRIALNIRRGLSIDSLAFKSQKFIPLIGTIHSYKTKSIYEGADFYSGNAVHEILNPLVKITDLNNVKPQIFENKESIKVISNQNLKYANLTKNIEIDKNLEKIIISIKYNSNIKNIGSLRLNNISFLNINKNKIIYSCTNGGRKVKNYRLENYFDQSSSPTKFVSTRNGLGCTNSSLSFLIGRNKINFKWDNAENYILPSIQFKKIKTQKILRVFFCNQEYDETSHPLKSLYNFKLEINSNKRND